MPYHGGITCEACEKGSGMQRGNVLVIGNSGVGKSTLINAVLGAEVAETSWGKAGTSQLAIYESDEVPFRLIDTIGFEPSALKRTQAIGAVRKWAHESAKEAGEDTQINLIWFCVDGIAKRLFTDTIQSLMKATAVYRSVPVVVVITKSFSEVERQRNEAMVREVFSSKRAYKNRLRGIVPVVAESYPISDTTTVPPSGIPELIELTNSLMPEGIQAASADIDAFVLKRKRAMAQGVVIPMIAAGAAVGALPIPIADAAVLGAVEAAEINAIAKIYGIGAGDEAKMLVDTIVNVGTVSVAAKGAISMLKAIPGINVAADVLNAVVAAGFVAALGEGCAYVFEKIYTGEKDINDIEWVRKLMEAQLSNDFVSKLTAALGQLGSKPDARAIGRVVAALFFGSNNNASKS